MKNKIFQEGEKESATNEARKHKLLSFRQNFRMKSDVSQGKERR